MTLYDGLLLCKQVKQTVFIQLFFFEKGPFINIPNTYNLQNLLFTTQNRTCLLIHKKKTILITYSGYKYLQNKKENVRDAAKYNHSMFRWWVWFLHINSNVFIKAYSFLAVVSASQVTLIRVESLTDLKQDPRYLIRDYLIRDNLLLRSSCRDQKKKSLSKQMWWIITAFAFFQSNAMQCEKKKKKKTLTFGWFSGFFVHFIDQFFNPVVLCCRGCAQVLAFLRDKSVGGKKQIMLEM